jgi:DNA-binding transcriptional MocR family regulator
MSACGDISASVLPTSRFGALDESGTVTVLPLSWIVARPRGRLTEAFAGARAIFDRHSPTADQHVLAAYMREGLFETHVRRIRGLYAERRAALLAALEPALPPGYEIELSDQGMHVLLWTPQGIRDTDVASRAAAEGLTMRPISPMYGSPGGRPGIMLGFGGFEPGSYGRPQRRSVDFCGPCRATETRCCPCSGATRTE